MTGLSTWNPAQLAVARKEAGFTQEEFAARLTTLLKRETKPIRTRNIVRWERPRDSDNGNAPRADFIGAIANATGKDIEFFLTESEEADPDEEAALQLLAGKALVIGEYDMARDLMHLARQAGARKFAQAVA